ncbi:D-alanyl-D-alanine carboxypeptidase family protein [Microbacterium halophytorum]|uniref:D-alanyl-D-alanine carboxypeptidase family protein n=1 Tax=Microbacterium halophytorum TaxID=2067568 RepID=UPI000CFB4F93|nr:D-alanyl-D-alanine carboxypeptidase [Microbacterium halophytorum]
MPTDDVTPAGDAPRDSSAPDEGAQGPLRAMSLSDLEPEPADEPAPRRVSRREARARREAARAEQEAAPRGEAAKLPVSTPVGGAFRSSASQGGPAAPDAQAPAEAPAKKRGRRAAAGAAASAAATAEPAPTKPAAATPPAQAAGASSAAKADPPAGEARRPSELSVDTRENPLAALGLDTTSLDSLSDGTSEIPVAGSQSTRTPTGRGAAGAAPAAAAASGADEAATRQAAASEATVAMNAQEPADRTAVLPAAGAETVALDAPVPEKEQAAKPARKSPGATALGWVSAADIALRNRPPQPQTDEDPEPLVPRHRRSPLPIIAPIVTAAVLAGVYVGACALWPLGALEPQVDQASIESPEGAALELAWPNDGTAAVSVVEAGSDITASGDDAVVMASITKLVSVLMVLERAPLEVGEDGPSYDWTYDDVPVYHDPYVFTGQSRLEFPIDGSLTEYQMLQGVLLGSANNYIDRLVDEVFGSREEFLAAVPGWLEENNLETVSVVDASGIDWGNTASAADMARLGRLALENPVVAEIVAQKSAEIPGAGEVENSNPLIGDEGVIGVKTGTQFGYYNLVTAKEIESDGATITVISSVTGQPDEEGRDIVSRDLLDQVAEAAQQSTVVVPAGTTVGSVTTEWGDTAELITPDDVSLVLWDGATAEISTTLDEVLGHEAGDEVGEVRARGSFAEATATVQLSDEVSGPSLGWRLSHPLALLGLD